MTYNFAAAFVEYCKGTQLEEIALALAIPYTRLKNRSVQEGWGLLVPQMVVAPVTNTAERGLEKIKENREKNFQIARLLQEDLLETCTKLRAGTLQFEKVFANGTSATVDPNLRDRADLANYAKSVAELSYRALGDVEQSKNAPADPALTGAQQITIVLPPAVSTPRETRAYDVEAEVVRIEKPRALRKQND